MSPTKASARTVLAKLTPIMLPAASLPALTYVVPVLNPSVLPHADLSGTLGLVAFWFAQSGSTQGILLLGLALTGLVVCRSGITAKQRTIEAAVIVLALGILLGGGAWVNDHVVKRAFAVPRPNIVELSRTPPAAPVLGMSAEAFYALPDKETRSAHLASVLTPGVGLDERVRSHWIAETGYSFPSGHSLASMTFATFFLALGLGRFTGRRSIVFYLLVPWAVAVCFSRTILRVHSPTDVSIGALEGIVLGTLTFLLVSRVLSRILPRTARDA